LGWFEGGHQMRKTSLALIAGAVRQFSPPRRRMDNR
jgi:hypothetical protein